MCVTLDHRKYAVYDKAEFLERKTSRRLDDLSFGIVERTIGARRIVLDV